MTGLDIATLLGLVISLGLVLFSIMMDNPAAIMGFIDLPSALITFGGAFMIVLASNKNIGEFVSGLKSFTLVLKPVSFNQSEVIKGIINLSNIARKDGLLALEEASQNIEDPFLKKGILL